MDLRLESHQRKHMCTTEELNDTWSDSPPKGGGEAGVYLIYGMDYGMD